MSAVSKSWVHRESRVDRRISGLLAMLAVPAWLAGCGDNVRLPTPEERSAFEATSSIAPTVDMEKVKKAKLHTGPYRVVPGDVLEFTMPALLRSVTEAEVRAAQSGNGREYPFICRVSDKETITLPAAGELDVSGKSLAEVERLVIDAYKPYAVRQPSVYVRVLEYTMAKVYIAGAVATPGVYTLRADQMTLVSLLTEAGGISETGAAVVRVVGSNSQDEPASQAALSRQGSVTSRDAPESDEAISPARDAQDRSVILPVVGMNIPFRDMALIEGDTVVVEPVQMPIMSLLGLVRNPGNFEYPLHARYNLAQAIALAGGLEMDVDPRYATVYRLKPDGTILRLTFRLIEDDQYTENVNVPIRPGDLVVVEQTPRTRTNAFLNNVLRINTGLYVRGEDLWD